MAGYVDEKVAKVTLDNKGFSKNADDTVAALEKMKRAFSKVSGKDATKNIASDMSEMNNTISNATQKSEGLLSRLKGIFTRSTQGINMSGAGQSIDQMNTEVENRTAKTSSILSRLKGIFQKADNHQGFPNSIKSIDGLNTKVSGFDASPLANAFSKAASSVQNSLSVMDIAMGNVLGGMMQKAISFGSQFFRGPTDGLAEYNNKLGSIQTIMTNTEWEIPDSSVRMRKVSSALEDLNDYADKTIYSFADMTRNIGTFTAAGVSLDKAGTAIKGISNLAAASGSNTQQAGVAMYQLSQALASGRVALQDWNSVVNAGMGGKLFQDRLTQVAERMGHARNMTKSFRDSLKDGWLTSEVLLETLREFSEDQSMLEAATKVKSFGQLVDTVQEAIGSGWATTWEYFLGGFEEAKSLWSSIGDIVNPFVSDDQGKYYDSVLEIERSLGNYRNAMLKTWKDMGGQQSLFNSITNSFQIVFGAMTKFREGFRSVIGDYKQSAQTFYAFTKAIENVTNSLKNNTLFFNTMNSLGKLLGQTITTLGWSFKTLLSGIKSVGNASGSILLPIRTAADSIARFIEQIRSSTNAHVFFYNMGKTIANVFNIIITVGRIVIFVIKDILSGFTKMGNSKGFATFASSLADVTGKILTFVKAIEKFVLSSNKFKIIGGILSNVVSTISNVFSTLFSKLGLLANPFANIESIFGKASEIFSKAGGKISSIISTIGEKIVYAFNNLGSFLQQGYAILKDAFVSFDVASILKAIIGLFAFDKWLKFKQSDISIFDKIVDLIKSPFNTIKDEGKGLIDKAGEVLDSFKNVLNDFSKGVRVGLLLGISAAVLMLAISIDKLSKIDMKDLSKGIIALGVAMRGITKVLSVLSTISALPKGAATTMIGFAIAIRILASSMIALSKIDADKMDEAVGGILVLIYSLVKVMQSLEKIKNTEANIGKLIAFTIAIRILVMSVKALAKLDLQQLAQSVAAVGVLMYALVKVAKSVQDVKISPKSMFSLIGFALSLRLVVWSVKALAKLDVMAMVPAVLATVLLIRTLQKAAAGLNEIKIKMSAMFGLIAFAGAIRLLVNSISILSTLDIAGLIFATLSVNTLLISLAASTKVIEGVKVPLSAMLALIGFAGSIFIIAKAIEKIAALPLKEMLISLGVVELIMASLVGATLVLNRAKTNMSAALSVIGFGASIFLIVKSLEPLASMPVNSILKSLGTVTAIVGGLIGASYLMNKVKMSKGAMLSIVILTASMNIITNNLMKLAGVNWASLAAAGGAIGAVMLSLGGAVKLMSGNADSFKEVVGLQSVFKSFGDLLYYIGTTLTSVGALSWQQIGVALGAVLVTIGAMVIVLKMVSKMEPNLTAIGALQSMSWVLSSIGTALAQVAAHPWQNILTAMAAITGVVLAMAGVGVILSKFGSIGGAAQLILLGIGLNALAVPIMLLSTLNLVAVGVALLALAGNLTVLLAAAAVAQVVSGGLTLLAGTLMSFGVSAILASASILIAGVGFLAFAMAIKELVAIAPVAFKTLVDSFVTLATSIAANSPTIVAAVVKTAIAMIQGVKVLIPEFIQLGIDLLLSLLRGIKQNMPELISTTVEMLVEMGRSLIDNIDILIQTGVELATKFIQGFATALTNVKGELIPALTELFSVIGEILLGVLEIIAGPLLMKFLEILQPLGDAIVKFAGELATAIEPVFTPLMEAIKALFEALPGIIQPIADIIITVVTTIGDIIKSLADIIDTVMTNITNIFVTVGETIQAWIKGVVDTINAIANVITATGDSIRYVLEGLDNIFVTFGEIVKTAFEGVSTVVESVGTAIKASLEGVGTVVESVGTAIKTALEGVGEIFESIGKAIKSALEGVADIIRSVGDAAKSFGEGFKLLGEGIKLIGEHGLNAAAGLGAFATEALKLAGIGKLGLGGTIKDLEKLGNTLVILQTGASVLISLSTGFSMLAISVTTLSSSIPIVNTSFESLGTSLSTMSGYVGPVATAFQQLTTPIQQLQSSLTVVATAFMVFATQITMIGTVLGVVSMAFTNIQNAITILGTSVGSLPTAFNALGSAIQNVQSLLSSFATSLTTSATGFQQLGQAATVGMVAMNAAVISGMAIVQATMLASITSLSVAVSVGFTQVSNAVTMSMTMVNTTVAQSMQGVMSVIQVSMSGVAAQMSASLSQVMSTVTSTMSQLSSSIMSSMTQVNSTISSSTSQMTSTFTQFSSRMQSIVSSMMSTLNSSFQSGMNAVVSTVSSGMSRVISTVSSYGGSAHSAGYSVGYQISAGVASGMNANMWSIESAANRIISKAREAARAAAQIHSPSRLFAKDVGKFIPQGVAKGISTEMPRSIKQMSKTFSNAFDDVASNAVNQGNVLANTVAESVNSISDMLDVAVDDMNYSPTITPVVDMSNLNKVNMSDYSLDYKGRIASPTPVYGVPQPANTSTVVNTDNSTKEYSINVNVDNGGAPVNPKDLAKQVQEHIKAFDNQNRRAKGEEVFW